MLPALRKALTSRFSSALPQAIVGYHFLPISRYARTETLHAHTKYCATESDTTASPPSTLPPHWAHQPFATRCSRVCANHFVGLLCSCCAEHVVCLTAQPLSLSLSLAQGSLQKSRAQTRNCKACGRAFGFEDTPLPTTPPPARKWSVMPSLDALFAFFVHPCLPFVVPRLAQSCPVGFA